MGGIIRKAAWATMLLFYLSVPGNALAALGFDIYLTNAMQPNGTPSRDRLTQFDCSDRIHIVVFVAGLTEENHELKVRWSDPVGNQRELTRFEFHGSPTGNEVWAWLQLHGPTGAIVGQMFDPSFGMEEFIGDWMARVFIDDEQVSEKIFQVLC